MFTPSRIRSWFLMITLATLAGCAEEGALVGPEESQSLALGRGGGGGPGGAPRVENFDSWNMTAWIAGDHPLGRGEFKAGNVSHDGSSRLLLRLPEDSYNGAEIRSASRVAFRDIEIRMKTPDAPGTISAFFLYQLVSTRRDRNDEIDIEILNDGSKDVLFTTYVRGKQTNGTRKQLPFNPADGLHDYRIEWSRRRVRFLVKDINVLEWTLMQEFTTGIPRHAMYVMSNAWWPTWIPEPPPQPALPQLKSDRFHEIDRIIY